MSFERSDTADFAALTQRWQLEDFIVDGMEAVQTPALVINREVLNENIATMRELLGEHWRPHVKTSKLEWTMRQLVEAGVTRCKCATPLELECALRAGFDDVLVAISHRGPAARRIADLAAASSSQVSVLVEDSTALDQWLGTQVLIFIDVDPGMNRTGIPCDRADRVVALARSIADAGLRFRGLHSFEGAPEQLTEQARLDWCAPGFEALRRLCEDLAAAGHPVGEIVTSGSGTWRVALSYESLTGLPVTHTVSPGTVVYADAQTALQVPARERLRPAAAVVCRVTSIGRDRLTLDAGHKAIARSTTGSPGVILGFPELLMQAPSEEHGPVTTRGMSPVGHGGIVAVIPTHIGPTVNLYDHAVIVSDRKITGVEPVTSRGHDAPF